MATDTAVNLYELLEIPPTEDVTIAEARRRIQEAPNKWNRVINTGVRDHGLKAKAKRDQLLRLGLDTWSDADLRQRLQQDRQALLKKDEAGRNQALERFKAELEFARLKGYIDKEEVRKWGQVYAKTVPQTTIETLAQPWIQNEQANNEISPETLRDIDSMLDSLGYDSLFQLVGCDATTSDAEMFVAGQALYNQAGNNLSMVQQKTLGGHIKVIFRHSALAQHYRIHVPARRFYRKYVEPVLATCEVAKVIHEEQAKHLIQCAERDGWDRQEAIKALFTLAYERSWRIMPPPIAIGLDQQMQAAAPQLEQLKSDLARERRNTEQMRKNKERAERDAAQAKHDAAKAQKDAAQAEREAAYYKKTKEELEAQLKRKDQLTQEEQRRLQELLDNLMRGEQERLRQRIAARAPIFSAHLQRRELFAARAVVREFEQTPEGWRKDVERCEREIVAAERLLGEARRLLTSSPRQAESKASEALALCADLEAAKSLLASIGIAPVSGLRAVIEGRAVRFTWNPSPSRDVTYVVVRSTERAPHTPQDGKQFGMYSQVEWFDNEPPAGRTLWYAVFAMRGSASSVAAPLTEPLYLRPDVDNVRVETSDQLVKLTWDYPPGARNIILVRNDDHMPTSHLDGTTHRLGPKSDFTDPDVENGRQYFYKVYCAYEDAQRQQQYSTGVGILATPEPLPSHVPSLSIAGADNSMGRRAIVITAESPERGRLVIYRTKQTISLVPGAHTTMEAVESLLGSDWFRVKDGKDILWNAGTYYYVPILEFQGTAIVGEPHAYVYQRKGA